MSARAPRRFLKVAGSVGAGIIAMFVGLIELMLEFVKPVTLSMRLFGNIYGGEVALGVITALGSISSTTDNNDGTYTASLTATGTPGGAPGAWQIRVEGSAAASFVAKHVIVATGSKPPVSTTRRPRAGSGLGWGAPKGSRRHGSPRPARRRWLRAAVATGGWLATAGRCPLPPRAARRGRP